MKAVRFHEFGGPEVLRHEDVEQPVPGAGQVRIRVTATSFNGVDTTIRAGQMRGQVPVRLPHTPGIDVAGTVDALGPGVDVVAVGDRVVGLLPMTAAGAAAEHVIAPAELLTGAPRRLPLADLAALPLVGLTAWQALFDHGDLTAGQRVLIIGAGGAVGGYAVQLAKEVGAQVVATAGPRSARRVEAAGADEVIDHTLTDLTAAVREPVDLVLDLVPVTEEELAALVPLIRAGGALVTTTGGLPAPSDEGRGVRGIDLVVRSDSDQLADLVARVCTGELVIDVAQRVALADLPALHARAACGRLPGKVVVLPAGT
ncbi:NADP-dependent oxidoreductase [Modestobacter sp. VKM Ac-2979]|uniref:NADP-dependent oxidoreductase n=1 Tax=unclassified Modestobacter TaxID=2643866 RepID=UPI0022AB5AF4|nr:MULTISPECIES: NADP-dependent oxidoreductase [unclassified Modestobacter]MCZ2814464.1 NADP-dependent oxidoreductase [Modestobacter sp. VKM Ac-2979]MCZ2844790.1 NADP-dependent oxidoreductase [Modestobacter sp. VKM Ac-2980]